MSRPAGENPFESTTSLSENPFEDPRPTAAAPKPSRAEELTRRERELEARERELAAQQERLQTQGRSNWPFFFPIVYHDIAVDIPEASRPLMKTVYRLWLILFATLIVNFVACIFILLSGTSDGGKDLGASIIYLVVITPTSFFLWYRPLYFGYMKEKSLFYYLYFLFCGFHLLFSVYMIIGIPSTGSAGLIQTISAFARHYVVAGILGAIASAGWIIQGVGNAIYYRMIWSHHKAQGHTFTKAKGEFAQQSARAYFSRG